MSFCGSEEHRNVFANYKVKINFVNQLWRPVFFLFILHFLHEAISQVNLGSYVMMTHVHQHCDRRSMPVPGILHLLGCSQVVFFLTVVSDGL